MKKYPSTRREFLRDAGVVAAAVTAGSGIMKRAHAQSANGKLGIGLIGCGGRGVAHIHRLQDLIKEGANIQIVAVCDIYRPRVLAKAEEAGSNPKTYMDHRELLADPNVDVVAIATPDHSHGYLALDAVAAGKHVYCEKPVTHWRQFELTLELLRAVEASDKIFQVGAQGTSDPVYHTMKKLVADGLIGKPIHAECGYFRVGDWGERGMPIDDPNARPGPDLNWEAFLADSPKRPFDASRFFRWRMYQDYSGGPVTDLFPHALSPVVDILGVTTPKTVVATGGKFRYEEREVPDTFNMLIDYPEEITVAVLGTQGNDYSATGARGAPGRIPVVRGWDGTLTIKGDEILFIPADKSGKEAQSFPAGEADDTRDHWRNLLHCIETGEKPNNPMDLAFNVQTALQMGMIGFLEGRVARYDAAMEKIVV